MRIFFCLLTIALGVLGQSSRYARWCQTYETVCPLENRVNLLNNVSAWVCVGPYKLECINVKVAKAGNDSCFPGDSSVSTRQGPVLLQHLSIGDEVQDADHQWTRVLGWLHRDANATYTALRINGRLSVSSHHLLRMNGGGYLQARHIQHGYVLHGGNVVNDIQKLPWINGAYAPFTASGTLLVDGIAASCYAHVKSHIMAHYYVKTVYNMGLWNGENLYGSWLTWPRKPIETLNTFVFE